MKNIFLTTLLPVFLLQSCGQKFYIQKDFTFYDKNFTLSSNSNLKTNGIYILDAIWTSKNGFEPLPIKQHKIYQFYKTGQSNFWFSDALESDEEYTSFLKNETLKSTTNSNQSTLFQGYYKINNDQLIIQNVNTSLKRFNYTYCFIETDKLIMVKENVIEGDGKFDPKYFTKTYQEIYKFKQLNTLQEISPNW